MTRANIREGIYNRFQRATEKLSEQMTKAYEKELKRFLAYCEKVFPGHKFTAQQAHGSLFIMCDPPIAGKNDISQWSSYDAEDPRISDINSELKLLTDWAYSLENTVSIHDIPGVINS